MKGVIGILTGGGDVPGLNPTIRALTLQAIRDGYQVLGIKAGWEGLVDVDRTMPRDSQQGVIPLDEITVNLHRSVGGTFLHTSRTNPIKVKKNSVPEHLKSTYHAEINDLTQEVIKNLEYFGID